MAEIFELIQEVSPYYKKKGEPESKHELVYESSSETLEPIYFFIIDLMEDLGLKTEKLVDNFTSTPGGGHFGDLGQKMTIMQQQGTKIMGDINTVLRSVLNIIYDLRDFRMRLQNYDDFKSSNKDKTEAAVLSLKQIWMDKVDIAKGNSSIKAMALGQAGFQTLIDAFLVAEDEKSVKELDLNDRVKRILEQRINEFNIWLEHSEKELRKRYALEKTYLRSQVNSLKLYSKWAKPYLTAASELEMKERGREPALVKAFNTMLMQLTLLGKREIKIKDAAIEGKLPKDFQKESTLKSLKRKYYQCVLVDFTFRGIPQKVGYQNPHYVFGGKVNVNFRAYSLNEDEINKLDEKLGQSEIADILKLIEGATDESLKNLQDEISFFLDEKSELPEEAGKTEEKEDKNDVNPILAIFGRYDKKEEEKKEKTKEEIIVKEDSWIEKEHLRKLAASGAIETAFTIFDVYKKAHGMASYDPYNYLEG